MNQKVGKIKEIRRFPVKSMGGENLTNCFVSEDGIEGDRIFALKDIETSCIVSIKNPKKWKEIIELNAYLDHQKLKVTQPITGKIIEDKREIELLASRLTSRKVKLVSNSTIQEIREADRSPLGQTGKVINQEPLAIAAKKGQFFDFAPIHIITTASLKEISKFYKEGHYDIKRFRPNLVIDTGDAAGFIENNWLGKVLNIGKNLKIKIIEPCPRCVVTTLKQGDLKKDNRILKAIVQNNSVESHTFSPGTLFKGVLGVYGIVEKSGNINLGDEVDLIFQN